MWEISKKKCRTQGPAVLWHCRWITLRWNKCGWLSPVPVSADRCWTWGFRGPGWSFLQTTRGNALRKDTQSHPMVPVLAVSSPILLPQPSESPPIQELPGWGLWSACTQEWIIGIEGHVFLASIMARGRHPHSGWHAALHWLAWILLAGLREQREVLRLSPALLCHPQPKHPS